MQLPRTTARSSAHRPLPTRTARGVAAAVATAAAGLVVACGDGPSAPGADGQPAVTPPVVTQPTAGQPAAGQPTAGQPAFVPGEHRDVAPPSASVELAAPDTADAHDKTAEYTVQPGGSTLSLGGGAKVTFPAGFVATPTTFTITRKAGRMAGYDFKPSGTFSKPVILTVKVAKTTATMQGAYVANWSQVDVASGTAMVNEFVPTTIDAKGKTATVTLSHFSGYIITTSRR